VVSPAPRGRPRPLPQARHRRRRRREGRRPHRGRRQRNAAAERPQPHGAGSRPSTRAPVRPRPRFRMPLRHRVSLPSPSRSHPNVPGRRASRQPEAESSGSPRGTRQPDPPARGATESALPFPSRTRRTAGHGASSRRRGAGILRRPPRTPTRSTRPKGAISSGTSLWAGRSGRVTGGSAPLRRDARPQHRPRRRGACDGCCCPVQQPALLAISRRPQLERLGVDVRTAARGYGVQPFSSWGQTTCSVFIRDRSSGRGERSEHAEPAQNPRLPGLWSGSTAAIRLPRDSAQLATLDTALVLVATGRTLSFAVRDRLGRGAPVELRPLDETVRLEEHTLVAAAGSARGVLYDSARPHHDAPPAVCEVTDADGRWPKLQQHCSGWIGQEVVRFRRHAPRCGCERQPRPRVAKLDGWANRRAVAPDGLTMRGGGGVARHWGSGRRRRRASPVASAALEATREDPCRRARRRSAECGWTSAVTQTSAGVEPGIKRPPSSKAR
jgi:hypothetical protein